MKRTIGKFLKLAVVLALLSMFCTLSFAAQEMTVNSTKLKNGKGVEVEWSYLEDFKGMDVWCAAYDEDGRIIAIEHANMKNEGKACRIKCDAQRVAYVKLFLLGEQIKPAEGVEIPGQDYNPGKPMEEQNHIHVWELEEVLGEEWESFLKPGKGRYKCPICKMTEEREIPAQAEPEQRELVQRAEDAGLLKYMEITDLSDVTRLDVAKLVVAYAGLDVDDTAECDYADCADLSSEEKRIINAAVEGGFIRIYEDGGFHPDDELTRSQFILILMNCMGNPECEWDETCTNVPEWNEYDANTLFNLGILGDDPDLRGNDYATRADTLEWLLNAKAWQKDNPGGGGAATPNDPAYAVTDIRFDMFMGEVPAMFYTISDDISVDARVDLYVPNADGKWEKAMGSNQGYFWMDWLEPGVYDSFKLVTVLDGATKASVIVDDMQLTINAGGVSSAQVTFEETADGYYWKAVNGQPDTCFSMEIVEENVGSCRPTGCFDSNGIGDGRERGEHTISHIENGTFVLLEYRDLTISDKSLTVTIWETEEKPCDPVRKYKVATAEELKEALLAGGDICMTADITVAEQWTISDGAAAALDLNGHKLSIQKKLEIWNGKEVSIIGTAAGSEIAGEISVGMTGKLTICGGAYTTISSFKAESVELNDLTATYLNLNNTQYITVSGVEADKLEIDNYAIPAVEIKIDGTFKNDPSRYLPDTHTVTQNADGTWTVSSEVEEPAETGYVIDLSLSGKLMSMTLTVPETADPDARYTYILYNSANEDVRYINADHGAYSIEVIPNGGYYDSYRVLLYDGDLGIDDQKVLGEGKLSKPMTVNDGAFTLSGITVTKGEAHGTTNHRFYFTGLDTDNYTYIFRSNAGGPGYYISNDSQNMTSTFFDEGAYIRAATTVEYTDEYVMDISNKYEVYLSV